MHRFRTALRGPLALGVALLAVVVGGVNVVLVPVGYAAGVGAAPRASGFGDRAVENSAFAARLVLNPLAADAPGKRDGTSFRNQAEGPAPMAAPLAGAAPLAEAEEAMWAAHRDGPRSTDRAALTGAERCRRFCVYRL